MKPLRLVALTAMLTIGVANAAEWIWLNENRHESGAARFERTFDLATAPEAATLTVTGDFASLRVLVNEQLLAEIEAYNPVFETDIAKFLKAGENRISLVCEGVAGPSAVAARLVVGDLVIETDETWGEAKSFGQIHRQRFAPNTLPDISRFDEYNQWREATEGAAARFSPLPYGFTLELLREAQEGEDSWVSMVFDPKGRIIIGKEKQGLLRLTLPKDDGGEIVAETIEDSLLECRGLLWAYDSLYVNANVSEGLYRLRDTNGDDQFDEVKMLRKVGKGGGHGRNDLALGPDGLIYSMHGDSVKIGDEDKMLSVPEPEGAKPKGHLARMDKDGNNWEILNRGLRNPYGIAFNRDGEPFTYDADNEGDVGLPLYRPTRVNHLVAGANYGWHQSADPDWSWPVWAPDTWPTTCDIGRGSPTSVKFGYGAYFPRPYDEALYVLDWAYGRIVAVHLTPRGASYYATAEEFLRGRPLNVTDMEIGPDNAMYFVTGGRKTQAALYRISYNQDVGGAAAPPSGQELARDEFSGKARELRRKLEGKPVPGDVLANLGSPDPWIRGAARVAFERLRTSGQLDQSPTLGLKQPLAVATAALGMARTGADAGDLTTVLDLIEPGTTSEKLTLLRAIEVADIAGSAKILAYLESLFPAKDRALDRELSKLLVRTDSEIVVERTQQLLADSGNQFDRLHYLEQLSHAKVGWTPDRREAYFRSLLHAKRFSSGDRNLPGFLKRIEDRALATAPEGERDALKTILAEAEASAESDPASPAPARPVVKQWTLADFDGDDLAGGDPKRGREMFTAALCDRCHQFGASGKPVGPDLTTVASRFSRRDLLKSLIEPSDVVAEPYRNYLIAMKDGSTVAGRLVSEDFRKSSLFISSNIFAPTDLTEISKLDIESYEETPVSPMPPSLLDTLTREEILDLLAFLSSP